MKYINISIIIISAIFALSMDDNSKINNNDINKEYITNYDTRDLEASVSWDLFLVDAAGGLGGAGAVANLGGAACPYCVAAGAFIGAAAASVPYALGLTSDDSGDIASFTDPVAFNSSNEYDFVGEEHNKIVRRYLQTNNSFDVTSYFEFVKTEYEQKQQFNKVFDYLTQEQINLIVRDVSNIRNANDALLLIKNNLPDSINGDRFVGDLSTALSGRNYGEILDNIKLLEKLFYQENDSISEIDKLTIKAFFSTLRHSSSLWNTSK